MPHTAHRIELHGAMADYTNAGTDPSGERSAGVRRAIDHLGRVVIPVEFRRVLGIAPGDVLDLSLAGDHILIRRPGRACAACGGLADLVAIASRHLCRNCRAEILAIENRRLPPVET